MRFREPPQFHARQWNCSRVKCKCKCWNTFVKRPLTKFLPALVVSSCHVRHFVFAVCEIYLATIQGEKCPWPRMLISCIIKLCCFGLIKGSKDIQPKENRIKCIDTTGRVKGIAVLGDRIFISKVCVKIIEGYSTISHNRVIEFPVNALEELRDMVACQRRMVLYLSDRHECAVIRVSVDQMETLIWKTGTIPEGLSVTDESTVLVSCPSENAIKEFTHDGKQVRMISHPTEPSLRMYHVWKMSNGAFLVCYGPEPEDDIDPIEPNRAFVFTSAEQTNISMYPSGNMDKTLWFLRVAETKRGFILIISYHEKQVLLLDSKLQLIRVLIETKSDFKPNRMCLDETNKRLYVSEHKKDSTRSRISIYDLAEDILNGVLWHCRYYYKGWTRGPSLA